MNTNSYVQRRAELEAYFDRTAAANWARLTSDAPVSRIRATVRAGRDRMRNILLDWLPAEMGGLRLLDAGCGTGALANAAGARGADVLAVDLAASLLDTARERMPRSAGRGQVHFVAGDMLSAEHGHFDYVVAMDSLIHYPRRDVVSALASIAPRVRSGMLVTFAPRTPLLAAMHAVGRLFPRGNRAPAIEPVGFDALCRALTAHEGLRGWRVARSERVVSGFYMSQALELLRA